MPLSLNSAGPLGSTGSNDPLDNLSGKQLLAALEQNNFSTLNEDIDFFSISKWPIDSSLFLKYLPYRLLLLQASVDATNQTTYQVVGAYILPINPQNIDVSTIFSNLATPLSDGMLIESNSFSFKEISIKGSTGFLPYRSSQQAYGASVFGRTQQAVQTLANIAQPAGQGAQSQILSNSGYVFFQQLSQFLETWAVMAKNNKNFNLRLAIDLQKENCTYLCIPKTFDMSRSVDSPLEYKYSITFQAWKRIQLSGSLGSSGALYTSSPWASPTSLANIVQDVRKAVTVLNAAANVIKAAERDFDTLLDQARQVVLAVKSVINLAATLADMPNAIVQGLAGAIASSASNIGQAVSNFASSTNGSAKSVFNVNQIFKNALNQYYTQGSLQVNINPTPKISAPLGSALSASASLAGSNPTGTVQAPPTNNNNSPLNTNAYNSPLSQLGSIFGNRVGAYPLLDSVNISTLNNIPQSIQSQIDNEYALVQAFTRKSFQTVRDNTNRVSRNLAVYFGQSVSNYASYYPNTQQVVGYPNQPLTRNQLDILDALRTLATNLDYLSSQNTYNNVQSPITQSFNYVGALLSGSGITFGPSTSKYAAPVPYGMTIDQISNLYLGDPNRSIEIITLNGLLPPYIDEVGTTQLLLVNGSGNSFVISDGSQLVLDQYVILSSNIVNPVSYQVKAIKQISSNEWLITVNTSTNLNNLLVSNAAQVQYFAIGTVNSQNTIYIPSSTVVLDNLPDRLKPVNFLPDKDNLQSFSLIDFLLTESGDLAINSSGWLGLAGGIPNLLQALKLKFLTVVGTNVFHPTYGAGITPGTPSSRIDVNKLRNQFIEAIKRDQRFGDVLSLIITLNNGALSVNGTVTLNPVQQVLPFGFVIQKQNN